MSAPAAASRCRPCCSTSPSLISGGRLGVLVQMTAAFRSMIGALAFSILSRARLASGLRGRRAHRCRRPPVRASRRSAVAIIYSGDGGWQDLDKTIGEWMAAKDIHVVGVSTMKAFWETREPKQVAADIEKMLADADPTGKLPVILDRLFVRRRHPPLRLAASRSEDAGPHPAAGAACPGEGDGLPCFRRRLAWHGDGELFGCRRHKDAAARSGALRLRRGRDRRHAVPEETIPGMEIVHTTGGHHFDEDYPKLGQTILDAFYARAPREPKNSPSAE